ncbi:hypothetical protein KFE25_010323 [Diacronema lutheri]|uniref:Uncharacterized protein n=1 Tax=Diacronema lutheri TaxID=2081491 RepID=A0A8J5X9T0_DIALT|nr:hypothetical protein KFE25_010323 [Diacronema lutheri]
MVAASPLVGRAVTVAQLAVQADEQGTPELRPLAISRYRRSVALIAAQLLLEAEPARRDSLLKFARLYQERARALAAAHGLATARAEELDLSRADSCALLADQPHPGTAPGAGARAAHADEDLLREALREAADGRGPPADLSGVRAPGEGWRRTYWLCAQLALSIERGAQLTADGTVRAPSAVWLQAGVRLAALAAKGAAFDELTAQTAPLSSLLPVPTAPPPFLARALAHPSANVGAGDAGDAGDADAGASLAPDASLCAAAEDTEVLLRELALYVDFLVSLHAALSRALPPGCNVPPPPAPPSLRSTDALSAGGAPAAQPPALGAQPSDLDAAASRLRKLGFFVARTASSLVGSSSGRPCADSGAYAAQVRRVLLAVGALERLHERCAAPSAQPALGAALDLLERAHAFVRDVVLALVTQDFGALLASYLRKAEEAFVAGDAG